MDILSAFLTYSCIWAANWCIFYHVKWRKLCVSMCLIIMDTCNFFAHDDPSSERLFSIFSPSFCNFVQGSLFLSSYYIVIRLPTLSLSCIPEAEFPKATLPQCYKHMNIWKVFLFLDEWVCSQWVGLSSISYLVLYILLSKLEVEPVHCWSLLCQRVAHFRSVYSINTLLLLMITTYPCIDTSKHHLSAVAL